MLLTRVLSALVAIPVALALVARGGWWLTVPLAALAVVAVNEFCGKARAHGYPALDAVAAAGAVGLVLVAGGGLPAGAGIGVLYALVMITLVVFLVRYHRDQTVAVTTGVAATVFAAVYVGATFAFFPLLRDLRPGDSAVVAGCGATPVPLGLRLLITVFLITWSTDSGAYFVGRSRGRRKLTPASPNKTVEGFVGGLAGALLAGLLAGHWLRLPMLTVPLGLVLGVTGQLGDLAKSILKRDLGTKDFGGLMPGHGGVLDRLDSLMMNVPLAYWLALLLIR